MTTLITGGFGFIGAHVVKKFTDAGESVVVTSYENLEPPSFLRQEVKNGLLIKQIDIGEPGAIERLSKEHNVNTIINLAIHRKSSSDPAEDIRINMDKLSHFFEGALKVVSRNCFGHQMEQYLPNYPKVRFMKTPQSLYLEPFNQGLLKKHGKY